MPAGEANRGGLPALPVRRARIRLTAPVAGTMSPAGGLVAVVGQNQGE